MGKSKRKPRPSMPHWWWLQQDGCWFCKNKRNCGSCSANKKAKLPKRKDLQEQQNYKEEINRRVDDAE